MKNKKKVHPNTYIDLSQDLMFKVYFTRNQNVLISLLQTFLPFPPDKKITKVSILNNEIYPDTKEQKQIVLDLRLQLDTGEKINVEMQSAQKRGFLSRVLFYWAKLYTEDLEVSQSYEKLNLTYSLVFTKFQIFNDTTDVVSSFSIRSDKRPYFKFSEDLKIVFIELSKFKKQIIKSLIDLEDYWCYTLKHSSRIDSTKLEQLAQKDKVMKEATKHLETLSMDDKLRMQEEARLKFIRDQKAEKDFIHDEAKAAGLKEGLREGLKEGRKKGLQEGLQEGREEGLQKGRKEGLQEGLDKGVRKTALNMLRKGFDTHTIKDITGLPLSEIQKIQEEKK